MDFKEFVNKLEQDLKDALSEISPGADVRQNSVEKLQGSSYTGISITPADSHVGMNLNADQLFEQLQEGKSYEGVLAMAVTQVDAGLAQAPDVNVADIMNYETAKQMLCFDVVGTERNKEMLENVPHTDVENMSMVYRLQLDSNEQGAATILITNDIMAQMGVTKEQLHQVRQSFKPGEVTPEEANRIGYETAMRWTKGKYAFIVATHTDKAHIHNHIVYNSTSLDGSRKFRDFYFSAIALRRLSDLICMEHMLSVIKPRPYEEREKRTDYPRQVPHRDVLCMAIDEALKQRPKDFDELIKILISLGYEYKDGKQPAVRAEGQKRYIRFRSLGEGYTKEDLEAILAGLKTHEEKSYSRQPHNRKPKMSLLIDIEAKLQEGKGAGYERWAKVFNLKQMANAMNFIQAHNIRSLQELDDFVNNTVATNDGILTSIKADEERLQEIAVLKKHILNYSKAKDTFAAYKASGYSKRFYEEHRDVLTLRKAAKQAFDEYREKHGEDVPIPRVKDLNAEYAEILARKKKNYTEYRREKSQMQEYLMAQKIVETMLHDDRNRQADQQREEQEKSKKQR